jgi:hypothetical protein
MRYTRTRFCSSVTGFSLAGDCCITPSDSLAIFTGIFTDLVTIVALGNFVILGSLLMAVDGSLLMAVSMALQWLSMAPAVADC